jgi:hypothetical protein
VGVEIGNLAVVVPLDASMHTASMIQPFRKKSHTEHHDYESGQNEIRHAVPQAQQLIVSNAGVNCARDCCVIKWAITWYDEEYRSIRDGRASAVEVNVADNVGDLV